MHFPSEETKQGSDGTFNVLSSAFFMVTRSAYFEPATFLPLSEKTQKIPQRFAGELPHTIHLCFDIERQTMNE